MRFQNQSFPLARLSVLGLVISALPARAATYYVSPTGGNSGGTSEATAVKWQIASDLASADPASNDTIIFLPGRYNRTNVGATGRDDCLISVPANVTIKAKNRARDTSDASQRSVLTGVQVTRAGSTFQSPIYQFIVMGGNDTTVRENVVIDGFEIENNALNGSANEAAGIALINACRRVQITGNVIHDLANGGIGAFNYNSAQSGPKLGGSGGADYISISRNLVYKCCRWFNGGGGASGISLLGLSNTAPSWEDGRTVHNFIQRNRVYDNRTSLTGAAADALTDNNGIIIDLAGGFSPDSSQNRRPAQTLIENNIVHGNDGRGIHVFKSSNVLVRNNTCYQNLQLAKYTNEGELSASFAKDVLFVNNVAYADGTNQPINSLATDGYGTGNGNVVFRYNVTGNGTNVYSTGVSQYGNVEGLTAASFNADLSPKALSPYTVAAQKIIDVGSAAASSFPNNSDFAPNDYYGTPRPSGVQVDRGAFETSVSTAPKAAASPSAGGS